MLGALKKLKRKRLEEVVGRTPRDWELVDEDDVRTYFELRVAPLTTRGWIEHTDKASQPLKAATARGVSRTAFQENGFRRYKGGATHTGASEIEQEIEAAYTKRMSRSRDERRAAKAETYAAVREHLLKEAFVCTTDEEPAPIADLLGKARAAAAGNSEEAHAEAIRNLDEALAPENLLSIDREPLTRRRVDPDELGELFAAELQDDPEPTLINQGWSYALGSPLPVTFSGALVSVIQELAGKAANGIAIERASEDAEGKDTPTSGAVAPRSEGKAKPATTTERQSVEP